MNITNDLRALITHVDSEVLPRYLNVAQIALEVQTLVRELFDDSTNDAEGSGRPKEIITPEIVDKIHGMILDDRRVKVRVFDNVQLQSERVFVPFRNRGRNVDPSQHTRDQGTIKTVVSSGEPESKKVGLSANKVMAAVFWDARGIIHIDYLQKGEAINDQYNSELLDRFDTDLKKKRPHLSKKKVLFHQDNARLHTRVVAMAKIHKLGYELLPHLAYSPDLAPCDYFLFPNQKK
ncbi:uncharacterized protein LOC117171040 [Belonocnema kinseyi]|uniref:uncharacterized protein LOC117171040 n=1 Tax=Belonocnema kinseyi TaxID=2817044 RepID=UPI00143D293F|nr:uncharacterized protein LOC117171040 [Belonocnema kinseyi]